MKKQITLNLAALLIGSAILFTFCKKETLPPTEKIGTIVSSVSTLISYPPATPYRVRMIILSANFLQD